MKHILGIDPGFANLGWAKLSVKEQELELLELGVIRTEPSDKKTSVLQSSDNTRRTLELARELDKLMEGCLVICSEALSQPRNASSAAKVATAWGVVVALAYKRRIPILQTSPKDLKRKLCGSGTASKTAVGLAVMSKLPVARGLLKSANVTKDRREHALDAVASVIACVDKQPNLLHAWIELC